jgi:hypothetical protein
VAEEEKVGETEAAKAASGGVRTQSIRKRGEKGRGGGGGLVGWGRWRWLSVERRAGGSGEGRN